MKYLAILLLSGCATFDQAYVTPPHLQVVCVQPVWSTQEEIDKACGPGTGGCGEVGVYNGQLRRMWVKYPESFSDGPHIQAIGHELMHALGATHGR